MDGQGQQQQLPPPAGAPPVAPSPVVSPPVPAPPPAGPQGIANAPTTRLLPLNTPDAYDGNPKTVEKFMDQCKLYLIPNHHVFDTDAGQIMFALSYMTKGAAQAWAHNFLVNKVRAENTGTWQQFEEAFTKAFMGSDLAGDARATLMQTRQGWDAAENKKIPDETVDSYVARFQVLADTARMLQEYGTLSLYFQKGLNKDVRNRIYSRTTLPTTMEEWYQAAQQIDK